MKKMDGLKIWLLQLGEPSPLQEDNVRLRTTLLAEKLADRGHKVLMWSSAFEHARKQWLVDGDEVKKVKNYEIYFLKGLGYRRNFSILRFLDHRLIAWKFRRVSSKMEKPDLIVASLPTYDLAYEAVEFSRKNNLPVVVDLRDKWPDIMLEYVPPFLRVLFRVALYFEFRMVQRCIRDADALVAMMRLLLGWGLKYAKREKTDRDRVFYLGCSKPDEGEKESENISSLLGSIKGKFVVAYVGSFSKANDPTVIVDSAREMGGDRVCYVLAGDGELFDKVKKRSEGLPNVFFTGWLAKDEIYSLLKNSDVGVCAPAGEFFPNKAFTYMSYGLPLLSSCDGELRDVIEKNVMGLYFSQNDFRQLTKHIKTLVADKILHQRMSTNSKRVFDERFDADIIYSEYAGYLESVVQSKH
ncbi:MAG: glycosyltransferase family 4 protein [Candidatus Altiarchaeota archaeon]|nr:glycosyltransferase family 4 protein [Candidatus Altiarchaeota archaeon]